MKAKSFCTVAMRLAGVIALVVLGSHAAHAGGGPCVTSPENPTILLAMLSTAGVAWQYLKLRNKP